MKWMLLLVLAGCPGPQKSAPDTMTGGGRLPPEPLDRDADEEDSGIVISETESAQDIAMVRGYDATPDSNTKPDPTTTGEPVPLDKEQIRRVIRHHTGQIRSCYEKQHKTTPEIAGVVRVRFTIDLEGKVAEAKAKGIHRNVEGCLETTFRQFVFPPPPSNVQVTYPFAFDAGV